MSVIGRLLWTSALVFLLAGLASSEVLPKVRKFIQVSDFHYDERYEAGAQVKGKFCHSSDTKVTNASDPVAGKYGDFRCDAPSVLVKSAIEAMHRVLPDPDFILWTGDNSPHDGDKSKRDPQITRNLRFIVKWMHETFGNTTKVVPVLGNHDSFPKDTFYDAEVNKTAARSQYRKLFRDGALIEFIGEDKADFYAPNCGFYAARNLNLWNDDDVTQTFLVLNTVLYHPANLPNVDGHDPCGQLKWLDQQLDKAGPQERVFIVAHIPPGYFDLWTQEPFFGNENVTRSYLSIVGKRRYAKKIVAHFYGHTHTSSYRLFYPRGRGKGTEPVGVGFIAPSVTPLLYQGGVNPSFRVYDYDPVARKILNFRQYYLPLEEANQGTHPGGQKLSLVEPGADSQILTSHLSSQLDDAAGSDRLQKSVKSQPKSAKSQPKSRQRNNGKMLKFNKRQASPSVMEEDRTEDEFVPDDDYDLQEATTTTESPDGAGDATTIDPAVKAAAAADLNVTLEAAKDDFKEITAKVAKDYSGTTVPSNCTDCTTQTSLANSTDSEDDGQEVSESVGSNATEVTLDRDDETTTQPAAEAAKSGEIEASDDSLSDSLFDSLSDKWVTNWFDAKEDLEVSDLSFDQLNLAYLRMRKEGPEGEVYQKFYRDMAVNHDLGQGHNATLYTQIMCVMTNYLNATLRQCTSAGLEGGKADPAPTVTPKPAVTTTTAKTKVPTDLNEAKTTAKPNVDDGYFHHFTDLPDHVDHADHVDLPDHVTISPPGLGEGVPKAAQAVAVLVAVVLLAVVAGVSFWYYRRVRINRYRSQEFLLTDSVFKYDGYSQLDQP